MVTIKQIEAFHSVARLGSIRRAAEQLNSTESALSKRLQEFEQTLAAPVFSRQGRALELNDLGQQMLDISAQMLDLRRRMMGLATRPGLAARSLRFGMTELIAHSFLARIVDRIRERFPAISLYPTIGLTGELVEALSKGNLDIVIAPSAAQVTREMRFEPMIRSHAIWVSNPERRSLMRRITPETLSKQPIIMQPSASSLHKNVMGWFAEMGLKPETFIACNNLQGLKELAKAGVGVAPLPASYCIEELDRGSLTQLRVERDLPSLQYGSIAKIDSSFPYVSDIEAIFRDVCVWR